MFFPSQLLEQQKDPKFEIRNLWKYAVKASSFYKLHTYLIHLMPLCDNFLSATFFAISFSYYAWKEMKGEFWPSEGNVHIWRPVFFLTYLSYLL